MHSEKSFNLTKWEPREGQKKTNCLQYPLLTLILLMPGEFPILGALSLQQFLAGTRTRAQHFNILRKLKTENPIPLKHFLKMMVYIATAWISLCRFLRQIFSTTRLARESIFCLLFCSVVLVLPIFILLYFYFIFTYFKWFVFPVLSCWSFTHDKKVRLNFARSVITIFKSGNTAMSVVELAVGGLSLTQCLYFIPCHRLDFPGPHALLQLSACGVRWGHSTWPQAWSSRAIVVALLPLREIELPIPEVVLPWWVGMYPLTHLVPSLPTKTGVCQI